MIFETERLIAKTWALEDLDRAVSLWGDPQVTAYFDSRGGLTREQVKERLDREMACQAEHALQYWPIYEKHSGEFVGCAGLKPWVHSAREGNELGFHLRPPFWGQGLAPEAARGVIAYAFGKRHFPYLMAGHHPNNAGARKILKNLGFEPLEEVLYRPTGLMHPSYRLINPASS